MRIETEFFPVIGAELGSSADTVKHYQKQLDDFIPNVKVFVVFPPTSHSKPAANAHRCHLEIFYQK